MSSNNPDQPEYLGSEPVRDGSTGAGSRLGRRTGLVVGVAVATVAAVGAGAYGVTQLMSGGTSAASAVPASAIGFVSLDLDPSAAQKIEAIEIMRKFPGLRSELDISSGDDLRRAVFREIQKRGDCQSLDYAEDVEPWIGNRVALAAIPTAGDEVKPLVALQVSDQDEAATGIRAVQQCAGDDGDVGIAASGDYVLISEKQADADAMATSAESAALADDEDFTTWMDRTGDSGIITMYAAKDAGRIAVDLANQTARDSEDLDPGWTGSEKGKQLEAALEDFEGAAGVIRFEDGAVEAEFSSKGLSQGVGGADGDRGPDVATLPGTTAAVLSVALQDGWLDEGMDSLRSLMGEELDSRLTQAEQLTGLELPEDAETLLGEGVSISVDSSLDVAGSPDPTKVPAGIRITGDAAEITAVIDKLKAAAGPQAGMVAVRTKGDLVSVGLDESYVDKLLEEGDLGESASFNDVVPESGRASAVLFVDFDAGDGWAERLADLAGAQGPRVKANLAPLDAFGVSSWEDDEQVQHGLLRLTTD